ncbi:hypothetical protein [Thermoactinospora rubra]|uniref:hypothetical protein n=1 Tax=Thermoactinospora rubra TaxID=1088767 RepID=UPI000A111763|nr:hypothetical protein [Thermoactinospora rubra]
MVSRAPERPGIRSALLTTAAASAGLLLLAVVTSTIDLRIFALPFAASAVVVLGGLVLGRVLKTHPYPAYWR